ncbi:MAG: indolepyruvate ferredoxin oxidoreductase subunit alpha [Candidatus Omnitrophica bacterium]|nr:indolepyruvate ferredoxin oxidoreductase subunit alpha [Candidatus Omnitrophota bacterium]
MGDNKNSKISFLSGNEAVAQGAYEEGLCFAASYPGTPASEILEYLSRFPEVNSQWSVNEKVAFEVALASAIAGRRSLYASKHVGLNVAMDPLMTSAYMGINAGFLVVSCDDPGIHSSQNEQDNRLLAKFAQIPLIEPASPKEARDFVGEAFKVSESFDTPVMLRMTTRVAHTKENMSIGKRKEPVIKEFSNVIEKYVMVPRNAYRRHINLLERMERLKSFSEKTSLNRVEYQDKRIGFITSGVSYLYAKEAYPEASFLKLGFSFPFPQQKARMFASQVKEVYVIEELEPFLEEELRIAGIKCKAKHSSYRIGELRPEDIPQIVKGKKKKEVVAPTRRPVMCAGCGHRAVFSVLKKLRLIVTGDIGCYTLGALPPLTSLHSCLCMGSGITFFEGFRKVLGKNVVGVIGDSTFVHSGIPALINLSYNKTNGVVIILDNNTTAMTGGQPHPATGVNIKGELAWKLILEEICKACGADNVDVVNPHEVKLFREILERRLDAEALSVIIARAPCRAIKREKNNPPIYLKDKCKKCFVCLELGCPALNKNEDGFIILDTNLCVGCNLCVEFCKFGALVKS